MLTTAPFGGPTALSRQYHPDIVAASGTCPKEIAKASKRMASINAAWDEVARSRRMRR